ncbi:MAG: ethanolamine ammonia-lyase subunit EutC [Planctomycetaceae bacterium]
MDGSPAHLPDTWSHLRAISPARIALGRAGGSLPTRAWLDFSLAHSQARDAVHSPFEPERLVQELGFLGCPARVLATRAADRRTFLTRPDWGRELSPESRTALAEPGFGGHRACDLVVIVSDGLSALAALRQVVPLLAILWPSLQEQGWKLAPVFVIPRARVALQDEVGELLGARLALTLLGERPGLLAPDSLGAYFVHQPRRGLTDADRNCVSNIHPAGLPPAEAAHVLLRLLRRSLAEQRSGVLMKDDSPTAISTSPPRLDHDH